MPQQITHYGVGLLLVYSFLSCVSVDVPGQHLAESKYSVSKFYTPLPNHKH